MVAGLRGTGHGTLRFEVHGAPARTAFLCPFVGPEDISQPELTPCQESAGKHDIVIFLADTFRADNLQAYGGQARVAPNINGFAKDALRFLRAWSPASWTLPAHASLFSAVYPYQHEALE